MIDWFARWQQDWMMLAAAVDEHPLLWVPIVAVFWIFSDAARHAVSWFCALAQIVALVVGVYVVGGLFALIVSWRERRHTTR